MSKDHWTALAERVTTGDHRILGEDEDGNLYVPSLTRVGWWDRRFNPGNPSHWRYWLRSRITGRVAWIEADR